MKNEEITRKKTALISDVKKETIVCKKRCLAISYQKNLIRS